MEIRSTGSSFALGTSAFLFDYNTAALGIPTKIDANDATWINSDADYDGVGLSSGTGYAGLTVVFEGIKLPDHPGDDNNGTPVPSTFTRIGTIQFPIGDPSQSSGLVWRGIGPVTGVSRLSNAGFNASQTDITSYGTFDPPINTLLLNFGFEVQLTQVSRTSGKLDVDIEIRSKASSSAFVLGTSAFLFDYNTAALGIPTKIDANDATWINSDADYDGVGLSSGTGYAGLTVVFEG